MPNLLVMPDSLLAPINDVIIPANWGVTLSGGHNDCGLFSTNYAPQPGDTLATYTAIESAFPSYVRGTWTPAGFSPSVVLAHKAISVGPTQTFVRGVGAGTETVYGFFVFNATNGTYLWAQLFDTPVVIANPGDSVVFSLQYTFRTQT